jgi:hypothetical protein
MTIFSGVENVTAFLDSLDPQEREAILNSHAYIHDMSLSQMFWANTLMHFSWGEYALACVVLFFILLCPRLQILVLSVVVFLTNA